MHVRLPLGRVILGLALALSLAIGSVAAIAAVTANNPGIASDAALAASAPAAHTNGMLHGQDSPGDTFAQVLCLIACMGLTAASGLPAPEFALAHPSYVVQSHIAGQDAGDQALNRPTSPPPRALATI